MKFSPGDFVWVDLPKSINPTPLRFIARIIRINEWYIPNYLTECNFRYKIIGEKFMSPADSIQLKIKC